MAAGGQHERTELEIFSAVFPEIDAIIDVGANSGIYSLVAAKSGKMAFAFEPLPDNLKILYRNLEANGLESDVEVFPIAASDHVGVVRFFGRGQGASLIPGWAGQPLYDYIMVSSNTLDAVLADRLKGCALAIKIDVEGAELMVLTGATRLLTQSKLVLLEHSLTRNQPDKLNPWFRQLFELMWSAGFSAFVADAAGTAVNSEMVDRWISEGQTGLETENFVFRQT